MWLVLGELSSAPDSNAGVSNQQHVGSSPVLEACVLKQDTRTLFSCVISFFPALNSFS